MSTKEQCEALDVLNRILGNIMYDTTGSDDIKNLREMTIDTMVSILEEL
jgi:hypothetical protein